MTTPASMSETYASLARQQAFVVGGRTIGYIDAMMILEKIAALDPDPVRRARAAVMAARLAGAVMFDFLERIERPMPASGSMEMPVGPEAERFVIASSGLGVLFGDESLLAVAQSSLGFSRSMQSRGTLASLLAPPLVWAGGEYVLRSSLPLLDDVLAHDHPAARLREKVAMRSWRDAHPKPMRGRGQPLVSLDGLDIEIDAPVANEAALSLMDSDWRWVASQLRNSGDGRNERVGQALAAFHQGGFRKQAISEADYRLIKRELQRPSRLGWLIRQRAHSA